MANKNLKELTRELKSLKNKFSDQYDQFKKESHAIHESDYGRAVEQEPSPTFQELDETRDMIFRVSEDLHERIEQMRQDFLTLLQEHKENNLHLPKVNSREQLQRIIENLGLESEFEIPRKIISSIKYQKQKENK